ncbi:MAG TPA: Holliday junction branch migration protein RuvA [Candidatus Marinimicrobia bacterium]|jgi:Holliday junction DNA helicase RuvA|nr:Holliday junction branch migration protein RuvA [Candidatus Neomarinimicrobiota bacterium]HHZ98298.1 Holliday junction branch migration protein RuvA [Candidatus Neomarinimicrobiota bacterium]HIB03356.1 Holliday junction branch migration protein RuvA [Candidatus Neomarinimicrobiota bacterium]HIB71993.1 Holliday junction branch migration protein RuvA [Candidatus Neomarinimicrobiota bacterium]HIO37237.1 Holliday junction branch migration protein RuvA [Candidatus Neomarinimicrobiota bacterium]
MIHSLRGKVKSKSATNVVVDVRGVAFYVVLSVPTADRLPKVGEEVEIRTYLKVREDAMELYGFGDEDELTLFKMLIGISKIGPKLAMGILSGASPDEFKRRIVAGDVASLTALPGIGSKTAKRIIVELKDKFVVTGDDDVMTLDGEVPDQFADALATLTALGFHRSDGFRVLSDMQRKDQLSGDVEEIVKIALTKL